MSVVTSSNSVGPTQNPSPLDQRVRGRLRQAAGVLDDLQAADHLALRVVQHLAVLGRHDPRDLVQVALDEVAEREHHACARGERDIAPARERRARGLHGSVDVLAFGEQDLGLLLAGRRLPDRGRSPRGTGRLPAGDPVLDGLERCGAHCVSTLSRVLMYVRCLRLSCS
jgi:hypothetical protein